MAFQRGDIVLVPFPFSDLSWRLEIGNWIPTSNLQLLTSSFCIGALTPSDLAEVDRRLRRALEL